MQIKAAEFWLIENGLRQDHAVGDNNGRVGALGISYLLLWLYMNHAGLCAPISPRNVRIAAIRNAAALARGDVA